MLDEYQKSDDSFFAPYLSYLFDETIGGITTGLLPSSWLEEGQESGLGPTKFEQSSIFKEYRENIRADGELKDKSPIYSTYPAAEPTRWFSGPGHVQSPQRGLSERQIDHRPRHRRRLITAFVLRDVRAGERASSSRIPTANAWIAILRPLGRSSTLTTRTRSTPTTVSSNRTPRQ